MSQLSATIIKTGKFFVRNRPLLLGIVLWPMVLTAIMAITELASIPASDKSIAMAYLTVSMVTFALMLACIMSFPSSIARDREIGLLVKLRSMPMSAGIDTLGRLLAYLAFAIVVAGLVALVGLGLGARFDGNILAYVESAAFLMMAIVAASGIGLIMGSVIKSVQGTAFLGLAVTLALSFTSGIFVPYSQLIAPLQTFSRMFPVSSAASSVIYLLLGESIMGYNPITVSQVASNVVISFILLTVGLLLYHATSWRLTRQRVSNLRDKRRLLVQRLRTR